MLQLGNDRISGSGSGEFRLSGYGSGSGLTNIGYPATVPVPVLTNIEYPAPVPVLSNIEYTVPVPAIFLKICRRFDRFFKKIV